MTRAALVVLSAGLCATVAAAEDFTWIGGFDPRDDEWSVPAFWSSVSGGYPDGRDDHALIDGLGLLDPVLDIDVAIGAVTIRGGSVLDTNGFEYSVFNSGGLSGDTIIEGAGSTLCIFNDPSTPNNAGSGIIVNDGGVLLLDTTGLPVNLAARKLDINSGGLVEGAGILTQLGRTGVVSNDGILRAKSISVLTGGTLVLQPWDAGDVFDWDGSSEDGRIELENFSELRIEMDVEPSFGGRIELYGGSVLDVQDSWTLADDGVLDTTTFIASSPARVRGGPMGVRGQIQVDAHDLVLETETFVLPTGRILVTLGNTIQFDAPATFDSAAGLEYLSGGTGLIVNNDVAIGSGLGSGRYDMDGPDGDHFTSIATGAALIIDADGIDETSDTFNAELELKGLLDITVADGEWEMAGRIDTNVLGGGGIADSRVIRGSLMRVTGEIEVEGLGLEIESSVIFDQGCVVNLNGIDQDIMTTGPLTRLNGGEILGGWAVRLYSPSVEVTASTLIDSFAQLRLGDGTTWNIQAPCLVQTNWITGELLHSVSPIEASTIISAPGYLELVSSSPGLQLTTIFGGNLELNTGSSSDPVLRGNRTFRLEGATTLNGSVKIDSHIELAGSVALGPASKLSLLGGTPEKPCIVEPSAFFFNSIPPLPGSIEVSGETRVRTGASLGGSEVNTEIAPGGVLTLEPGTDGGRVVQNSGTIKMGDPGDPIGSASTDYFLQSNAGRLEIRVGPSGSDSIIGFTQFPLKVLTASLSGELVVTLEPGHVPGNGDEHTIIAFDSRSGEFDTVTGPPNMEVIYDPGGVRIRFTDPSCNPADLAEPFGTLDFSDVVAFLTAFGAMDAAADLAPPTGVFDFSDVVAFLGAFGAGCP